MARDTEYVATGKATLVMPRFLPGKEKGRSDRSLQIRVAQKAIDCSSLIRL